MAVTNCAETAKGTSGTWEQNGVRHAARSFLITVNDQHDGQVTVLAAAGLPQHYDIYQTPNGEFDAGMVVIDRQATRRDGSRFLWDVNVEYSSEYERLDDPLKEAPEIEISTEEGREPIPGRTIVTKDSNSTPPSSQDPAAAADDVQGKFVGDGIVNSAKGIYDPPAERRISTPIVTFTRNEKTFSLASDVVPFVNAVNASIWNGLQPRQAFCRSVTGTAMYWKQSIIGRPDLVYYRVSRIFALKAETWDLILTDAGPHYLYYPQNASPRRKAFIKDGVPYIGLLDHSDAQKPGRPLFRSDDNGSLDDSVASMNKEVQYLRWRIYREKDFASLNINLNLALTGQRLVSRGVRAIPDPSKTPIAVAS